MPMHYHDRFKVLRAAAAEKRESSLTNADRADLAVHEFGAASQRLTRQFHGRTADGTKVSMYSTRWPDDVRQELTERAGAPLVHFRWSHSDIPFDDYEPRSSVAERQMAALSAHGKPGAAPHESDISAAPAAIPTPTLQGSAQSAVTVGGHQVPLEVLGTLLSALGLGGGAGALMAPAPVVPNPVLPKICISDRIEPFLAFVEQKKSSRSTFVEHAATLRMLMDTIGDKALTDIGPTDLDAFLGVLRRWPTHASKRRAYRNLSAQAVVRKAQTLQEEPIDVRTQQGYIDRLRRFFLWLEHRQEIRPNLMKGIRLVNKRTPFTRPREPFNDQELDAIFSSTHLRAMSSPAHYWLPILALYTGLRLRELAQLYVDDVVQHGGRWYFYVSGGRKGQHIKTASSQRMVPLHDRIIGAGFLDYLAEARDRRMVHLFPGLNWEAANGPGDAISDWFARTLRNHVGIDNPTRTFHSFRHCFATLASRSGVRDGLIAELLGHDTSHSTLNTYYVSLANLTEKCWGVDHIQFPTLNHPVYQPGRFDGAFRTEQAQLERQARLSQTYGRRR